MADKSDEEKARAAEANIEMWKIKKLIKKLEEARGCVTATTPTLVPVLACAPPPRGCLTCHALSLSCAVPQEWHQHDFAHLATQVTNLCSREDACR
jgi:hypothetical protein